MRTADTVPAEPRGFDAGKKVKGRKRFIVTDTLGLLPAVHVVAAARSVRCCGSAWTIRACRRSGRTRASPAASWSGHARSSAASWRSCARPQAGADSRSSPRKGRSSAPSRGSPPTTASRANSPRDKTSEPLTPPTVRVRGDRRRAALWLSTVR
ncbi:hypothetical protein [Streptomyces sp. NPDC029526]|uniref:hypothetical protein n=1 Tax=Streptomyces sp. NPDC029526 TaxID=3155728 RepID=UPI00340A5CCC